MSLRIGILSDTHGLLRPEVLSALSGCGRILHGGDICDPAVLSRLRDIAPTEAVRGNNDRGAWAEELPLLLETEASGLRICMAHKRKDLPGNLEGYDLAVFGHSHRYFSDWLNHPGGKRTLLLNPGSCGPGRFRLPVTLALLTVDGQGFAAVRKEIRSPGEGTPRAGEGDLRAQIALVIRETRKGRTVEDIARQYGMEPALTEQIARLYLTHPGVTEEGIMTKMGL